MNTKDEKYERLWKAAYDLYVAGKWQNMTGGMTPGREAELWEELRDSLGLPEGYATRTGVHNKK